MCVRGKGHADGLLFVTIPRTQPPLYPTLRSSHHWLPASLSHEKSFNCAQTLTCNLSEPVVAAVADAVVVAAVAVAAVVVVVVVVEWLIFLKE